MANAADQANKLWHQALKQGRPLAEKMVAEAPAYYRSVRKKAEAALAEFKKQSSPQSLAEKKALIEEFWRLRQSLDIIALLDPQMIKTLTGLDVPGLNLLRKSVVAAMSALKR